LRGAAEVVIETEEVKYFSLTIRKRRRKNKPLLATTTSLLPLLFKLAGKPFACPIDRICCVFGYLPLTFFASLSKDFFLSIINLIDISWQGFITLLLL
jgi:hypothetical protein